LKSIIPCVIIFSQIRTQLLPVLKKKEKFCHETAKAAVSDYLSRLMALTDNEFQFVENFYLGVYQPDLLFEDVDIIERIKEHPMAVWRTMEK